MKVNFFTILFILLIIFSCSSSKNNGANKNVAGIYMPGLNLINPKYKIFHKKDSLTEVHFRLNSTNLLYTKKRNDTIFSSNILIHYELINKETKALTDSASILFSNYRTTKKRQFLDGIIPLKTLPNNNYDLVITVNDLTRDHYIKKKININRSDTYNIQNFLILNANKTVVFKTHFNNNDTIYIKKNESISLKSMILKYYSTQLPIAKPPFSTDDAKETIVFKPQLISQLFFDSTNLLKYIIKDKGLYHFQTSENIKTGPTLFNFQDNFPAVKNPENMIGPMRYISTKKEYALLTESEHKKMAVDKHWLNIASSSDRARTLIREYYKRVENSNHYFTSYLEGWKTDRGIIYIIYGSPNVVYKNKNYENWIYGEENNMMSINFMFYKVNNPASTNDYSLSRSPLFKGSWFRAVDSWRNGRIY